ncbi:MAG: restriction endonuclease subunit S [Fusobacteriaceae bacterium]
MVINRGKESKKGDILFTVKGSGVGTLTILKLSEVVMGRQLMAITSKKNSTLFLSQYLKTKKKYFESLASGNMIPGLSRNDILDLKCYFPLLSEQEKIASFLSEVDIKIEKLEKKKELLSQYKKGMIQKLFSQKLRFKDENGNDYPDWEERKLGEISSNIMYGMNSSAIKYDGKNKYIRITDINEKTNKFDPNPLCSPSGEIDEKFLVNCNDILFTRTGASTGKSYIYNSKDGKIYFAGFLIRFNINFENNSNFIFYQTLRNEYKNWLKIMSMRSGQPGINAEEYKELGLFIPVLAEQEKIANFLSSIDKKIELVDTELERNKEFKNGLLQKMFV